MLQQVDSIFYRNSDINQIEQTHNFIPIKGGVDKLRIEILFKSQIINCNYLCDLYKISTFNKFNHKNMYKL